MAAVKSDGGWAQVLALSARATTRDRLSSVPDRDENRASWSFSRTLPFRAFLPVPISYPRTRRRAFYLQEDLERRTLFRASSARSGTPAASFRPRRWRSTRRSRARCPRVPDRSRPDAETTTSATTSELRSALESCGPNYFKYYFLRWRAVPFHRQAARRRPPALHRVLAGGRASYFMYRDFQSRNIRSEREPWFVDYQGRTPRPLQYDISHRCSTTPTGTSRPRVRTHTLEHYIDAVKTMAPVSARGLPDTTPPTCTCGSCKAFGAYGLRILRAQDPLLQSIPYAIGNLEH